MTDRYFQLIEEAGRLPTSTNKTAILEDAVREADAHGNGWLSFDARDRLIENTVFSGEIEKAIVAFTWCIAKYDEEEEYARQDSFGLLWSYRWIVASITSFPFIEKSKIFEMEDDIIERFRTEGYGVRSLYIRRWLNARDMGDVTRMEDARTQWTENPYDYAIECLACDMQSEISYLLFQDDFDGASDVAHNIFKNTGERCNRVPLATYAGLLEPLVKRGDLDQADRFAQIGETFMGDTSETLADAGRFMTFYLQRNQIDRAIGMFESHAKLGLETSELDLRLDFLVASENLAKRLNDRRPTLPAEYREIDDLSAYFREQGDEIAAAFDKRNGNRVISEKIQRQRERVP